MRNDHLHPADIRGASRLVIDAIVGIADVVEAMHIAHRPPAGCQASGVARAGTRHHRAGLSQRANGDLGRRTCARQGTRQPGATGGQRAFLVRPRGGAGSGERRTWRLSCRNRQRAGDCHGIAARWPAAGTDPPGTGRVHPPTRTEVDGDGARPVQERPAMGRAGSAGIVCPRPRLYRTVPALQQRPACLHQRPRIRGAAGAIGGAMASCGRIAGHRGAQHGRTGHPQRPSITRRRRRCNGRTPCTT